MHHGEGLRSLLVGEGREPERARALVDAVASDPADAGLSAPDRAMLEYVEKLTRSPEDIDATDIENLREEGFDDRAIHDMCAVAAYYAFVNRIADGLGVEVEEGREES